MQRIYSVEFMEGIISVVVSPRKGVYTFIVAVYKFYNN